MDFTKLITLTDYLKTHSDVNHEFIDDFFLINYNCLTNLINLEKIIKWTDYKKNDLKKYLFNNYKEKKDYKIKKDKKNLKSKNETILLTPSCLRSIIMLKQSDKNLKLIEDYFKLEEIKEEYTKYLLKDFVYNYIEKNLKKIEDKI